MAVDAIDFFDALELGEVDLLGFSIRSFVAHAVARDSHFVGRRRRGHVRTRVSPSRACCYRVREQ
jgi:hypothetical protein